MRVLVVTNMWPTPEDPAFGIFVAEQVADVRALGVVVDVFVIPGRTGAGAYLWAIGRLWRELGRRGGVYDVVHAHYVLAGLVAWLAGAQTRWRPLVVTHHGIEVFQGWQAPVARWLTRRVRRALVISAAMARHLGLDEADVVPCGVDLASFRPGDRAAARRALGLAEERALVAWVGADRPEKRLGLAREAVVCLNDLGTGADLVQVGGRAHGEVPAFLQACDVLLVTSTFEGGPLVVKEALACDRAVVSTDVGDVREVVAGVAGCAVVADPTPMALALALREAIGHGPVEGRGAVAIYDSAAIARRVVAVYREVAGGKGSGGSAGGVRG